MQREVLNRSVVCSDGVSYEAGTLLSVIPADNRESCQRSGWTRIETVASDEDPPADDSSSEQSNDPPAADPVVEQEVEQVAAEQPVEQAVAEATDPERLEDSGLDSKIVEILAEAGIFTKFDARNYLSSNKTFRTIEGIGKASDAAIRAVIE